MKSLILIIILVAAVCATSVSALNETQSNATTYQATPILTTIQPTITQTPLPPPIIEPKQGGDVYLGEFINVQLLVGWTNQLAWFKDDQYGSQPDLIVDASSFQKRFYIDPAKFRIGMWYKWDNVYEPAGNNEAFRVRPGTRPTPTPTINFSKTVSPTPTMMPVENVTPIWTRPINASCPTCIDVTRGIEIQIQPQTTQIPIDYKQGMMNPLGLEDFQIIAARGDLIEYRGSEFSTQSLGSSLKPQLSMMIIGEDYIIPNYPIHLETDSYWFRLLPEETWKFRPGEVQIIIQSAGRNGIFEVYWDDETKTIRSPWKSVKDIETKGLSNPLISEAYLAMLRSNSSDDQFILKSIHFENFWAKIDSVTTINQDTAAIIRGSTNAAPHTAILFIIDRDKYGTEEVAKPHYFQSNVEEGKLNQPRKWVGAFSPTLENLAPGWHELKFWIQQPDKEIDRYAAFGTTDFWVHEEWVNPEPTKVIRKYIEMNESLEENKTTFEPTVIVTTPTPIPTPTTEVTPRIIYVTTVVTVMVTPSGDIRLEIPPTIPVISMILVAVIVLWKRRGE